MGTSSSRDCDTGSRPSAGAGVGGGLPSASFSSFTSEASTLAADGFQPTGSSEFEASTPSARDALPALKADSHRARRTPWATCRTPARARR